MASLRANQVSGPANQVAFFGASLSIRLRPKSPSSNKSDGPNLDLGFPQDVRAGTSVGLERMNVRPK